MIEENSACSELEGEAGLMGCVRFVLDQKRVVGDGWLSIWSGPR